MFGLVGAGAGLLGGALFRTEQMAYGVGIGLGIAFIYLTQLDPYSALSPHRWAWDALDELAGGGGFAGVLPELGVLALFAAALAVLASWRFHRAITT